jgi:fumarate hydratase class II
LATFSFQLDECRQRLQDLQPRLRSLAHVLSKLHNDLRWMGSGPLAGIEEIQLEVAAEETGLSRAGLEGLLDPTPLAGI